MKNYGDRGGCYPIAPSEMFLATRGLKIQRLITKTKILHVHHAFLHVSLPSLHDYGVKMPNFTLYRGSTQATTKFPLYF